MLILSLWGELINGLVQDYSNSIANALQLLQFCTKPSYSRKVMKISCDFYH